MTFVTLVICATCLSILLQIVNVDIANSKNISLKDYCNRCFLYSLKISTVPIKLNEIIKSIHYFAFIIVV